MDTRDFSVLVLTHRRTDHLRRLLTGVENSSQLPREIVIVHMDEAPQPGLECRIPLVRRRVDTSSGGIGLPLARARNAAAEAARGPNLIFLDVDCIPSAGLFADLLETIGNEDVLSMAQPRYLRKPLVDSAPVDDGVLEQLSVAHHSRAGLAGSGSRSGSRHEMFWSLGFAITATNFHQLGGFDPGYAGYGAEDTDFAFRARDWGLPMRFVAGDLFHQWHVIHKPPLQHFEAIIANARFFKERWQQWPMEGWLTAFAHDGLIHWNPESTDIQVLRIPGATEIEATRSTNPY